MSRFLACDAPECQASTAIETEAGRTVDPPEGWLALGVRQPDHLRPYRTLHACGPEHAVSALADALDLELDPAKVRP